MIDEDEPGSAAKKETETGFLFWVGAGGLMVAMVVEGVAVVGRHIGLPVHGSIELVQVCVLLTASAAMLSATLNRGHAVVHLLTSRLSPAGRAALERLSDLLSGLFFAVMAAGCVWLLYDLWDGHEQTEVLGLPFKPLRFVALSAVAAMAAVFLARAVRSGGAR